MVKGTSIRELGDRLMAHPMLGGMAMDAMVRYCVDFIGVMKCGGMMEEKVADIGIEEWRGEMPCDWCGTIGVRLVRYGKDGDIGDRAVREMPAMRYSSDAFHYSQRKKGGSRGDLTYKTQGGMIYTSIKEGVIEMAYEGMAVDGEGWPVLMDDAVFMRALEAYVKAQVFRVKFDMGKVTKPVLDQALQDYAWCAGQLRNSMSMPDPDKAEAIAAVMNTWLLRGGEHRDGYVNVGTREHLKF